jgi:branched-chain amino acid transport system permease protein
MRERLTLDSPILRSLFGTGILGAILVAGAALVLLLLGAPEQQVTINFLVAVVAVVGFQIYSGNSGILTFGHVAFVGIAAYASGILTMPVAVKEQALPNLPPFIAQLELPLGLAIIGALLVVAVVAVIFGVPFSRLSAAATPIATMAMLLITYVVLVGAADVTRGSQTFYGVPPLTGMEVAVAGAIVAILVARLFRESVPGLRLRASREDELAARSTGVNVARLRFVAWMLSALVVGLAGVLLAHNLTAFSPKQFYLPLQFALVAMLVVGGPTTVTGAVGGTFLVSLLLEVARRAEGALNGIGIGTFVIPEIFGLQEITLGLVILAVMYRRREGLFGRLEVDEWLARRWTRRRSPATVPEGPPIETVPIPEDDWPDPEHPTPAS